MLLLDACRGWPDLLWGGHGACPGCDCLNGCTDCVLGFASAWAGSLEFAQNRRRGRNAPLQQLKEEPKAVSGQAECLHAGWKQHKCQGETITSDFLLCHFDAIPSVLPRFQERSFRPHPRLLPSVMLWHLPTLPGKACKGCPLRPTHLTDDAIRCKPCSRTRRNISVHVMQRNSWPTEASLPAANRSRFLALARPLTRQQRQKEGGFCSCTQHASDLQWNEESQHWC